MDDGPRSCAFCTKSFPSIDKWTLHYNSQHSTEYRAPIFGHHTCKNCYKFISTERWFTHSCRKPASKTRADATPTTRVGPLASEGPTNMSVDLETYLIPLTGPAARVPTATSTPRVSSIVGAPDDRTQGRSSFFPSEEQRGDILEPSKAGVDLPVRHLGTIGAAGGDPPSKPTAAGPSAGPSDSATRSLRSASATVSSKAVDGRKKEGSGPPTSVKDGGFQPPPSVGEVSGRPTRGVSHAPTRRTPIEHSSVAVEQSSTQTEQRHYSAVTLSSDRRSQPGRVLQASVEPHQSSASASGHPEARRVLRHSSRAAAWAPTRQQRGAPALPPGGGASSAHGAPRTHHLDHPQATSDGSLRGDRAPALEVTASPPDPTALSAPARASGPSRTSRSRLPADSADAPPKAGAASAGSRALSEATLPPGGASSTRHAPRTRYPDLPRATPDGHQRGALTARPNRAPACTLPTGLRTLTAGSEAGLSATAARLPAPLPSPPSAGRQRRRLRRRPLSPPPKRRQRGYQRPMPRTTIPRPGPMEPQPASPAALLLPRERSPRQQLHHPAVFPPAHSKLQPTLPWQHTSTPGPAVTAHQVPSIKHLVGPLPDGLKG